MFRFLRIPKAPDRPVDLPFLIVTAILVIAGAFIFASASLGLLARPGGPSVSSVIYNQFLLGLVGGGIVCYLFSRIDARIFRKYAIPIFIIGLITTTFVFIPGLGFEHGGAKRWIHIFGHSLQPAELLKFAAVVFYAALLTETKGRIKTMRGGLLPLVIVIAPIALILMFQPDLGTFGIITFALIGMFLVAGAKKRHLALIIGIGFCVLLLAIFTKPYAMDRIETLLDPTADPRGSGYQIIQSQNAIGAGGVYGRGFGQSLQKFRYLPEPMGDSIFAVAGEEFGLIGTLALIMLYIIFASRGLSVARHAPDKFGGLVVVGIVILMVSQSFINIASMVSLFPLTGVPLVFVSQGGTALATALAEIGVILSISRTKLQSA